MNKSRLNFVGKMRTAGVKTKAVANRTLSKARDLPVYAWEKFNGKKFITGIILTGAALVIELYVPFAKPVSGYLMSTGVSMGLVGLGHKAVKHKAFVLKVVKKLSFKKG